MARTRSHWIRGRDNLEPNTALANAVSGCSVLVIDAPLHLRSEKPSERQTHRVGGSGRFHEALVYLAILSHAWRAFALRSELCRLTDCHPIALEIFPASWFWLCEFDDTILWKGDETATVGERSLGSRDRCSALDHHGLRISYEINRQRTDDADALPCVLCPISIAEKRVLQRLDITEPPVLFPPKELSG